MKVTPDSARSTWGIRKNPVPYLTGAAFSYVFCVVHVGREFTAGAAWSIEVAVFGALCFWPFAAGLHLAFQALLGRVLGLVWRPARVVQGVVLNAPIVALILWAGVNARSEPARAFAHFLADPVPQKVRFRQFGRSQEIGESVRLGLAFEIPEADLLNILQSGGYAPAALPTSQDPLELEMMIESLSRGTGLEVEGLSGWQYHTSTNSPGRHLLWRTNDPVVFFFYAKPRG